MVRLACAGALALSACGSGNSASVPEPAGDAAHTVTLTVTDDTCGIETSGYAYGPQERFTLRLENQRRSAVMVRVYNRDRSGALPEGQGPSPDVVGRTYQLAAGEIRSDVVTLPKGTYAPYCEPKPELGLRSGTFVVTD